MTETYLRSITVQPTLLDEIKSTQMDDLEMERIKGNIRKGKAPRFYEDDQGIIRYQGRACVLDFQGKWEEYLPLAEFLYNNSYQATVKTTPFEALYGSKCRTLLCWNELDETLIVGPEKLQDMIEKIRIVQQNMKAA